VAIVWSVTVFRGQRLFCLCIIRAVWGLPYDCACLDSDARPSRPTPRVITSRTGYRGFLMCHITSCSLIPLHPEVWTTLSRLKLKSDYSFLSGERREFTATKQSLNLALFPDACIPSSVATFRSKFSLPSRDETLPPNLLALRNYDYSTENITWDAVMAQVVKKFTAF